MMINEEQYVTNLLVNNANSIDDNVKECGLLRQLYSAVLSAVPSKLDTLHVTLPFCVTDFPLKYSYFRKFVFRGYRNVRQSCCNYELNCEQKGGVGLL
jgi:hypothetical protein